MDERGVAPSPRGSGRIGIRAALCDSTSICVLLSSGLGYVQEARKNEHKYMASDVNFGGQRSVKDRTESSEIVPIAV